jgi:hypothetical protein
MYKLILLLEEVCTAIYRLLLMPGFIFFAASNIFAAFICQFSEGTRDMASYDNVRNYIFSEFKRLMNV